jgi:hypothetical protein
MAAPKIATVKVHVRELTEGVDPKLGPFITHSLTLDEATTLVNRLAAAMATDVDTIEVVFEHP